MEKKLVFRAPDAHTAGYPKRLRAALRFQVTHSELMEAMKKLGEQEKAIEEEIAAIASRENSEQAMADVLKRQSELRAKQAQSAKDMLQFWDDLMTFLSGYIEAETPEMARELLEECSESQLTELLTMMGGGMQTLPPQNTEPSKG